MRKRAFFRNSQKKEKSLRAPAPRAPAPQKQRFFLLTFVFIFGLNACFFKQTFNKTFFIFSLTPFFNFSLLHYEERDPEATNLRESSKSKDFLEKSSILPFFYMISRFFSTNFMFFNRFYLWAMLFLSEFPYFHFSLKIAVISGIFLDWHFFSYRFSILGFFGEITFLCTLQRFLYYLIGLLWSFMLFLVCHCFWHF